jgi:hypothetical protein
MIRLSNDFKNWPYIGNVGRNGEKLSSIDCLVHSKRTERDCRNWDLILIKDLTRRKSVPKWFRRISAAKEKWGNKFAEIFQRDCRWNPTSHLEEKSDCSETGFPLWSRAKTPKSPAVVFRVSESQIKRGKCKTSDLGVYISRNFFLQNSQANIVLIP